MPGRLGRISIVATLLCTLLVPAAGSLAGDSKLEKIRSELGEVREKIEAREAKADPLEETVDELNAEILELRNVLTKIQARIVQVEAEVRTAQAQIDETQAKIDKIKGRATEQAISLYKAGSTETIDALLNAQSLSELDAKVEMLGVAAEESTGALIKFGRLQVEIEAQNRALFQKKEELEAIQEEHQKSLAKSRELHAKRAERLAVLQAEIGKLEGHEGNLEAAANDLIAKIRANSAAAAVKALGTSSAGYIWPLNGAVTSYYGPRWGSMHTGIDIDGVTGQAIVASKAGTVIMAGSYSGYGNAVIIDHGGGYQTLYGHLSSFAVSSGQTVSQAQTIGAVGCTGSCTGDHLHFEVRVNGSPTDPMQYLP